MIRVFPRRTKWTPTDDLAFVGDPPLFRPPEQPVKISVTFTWDIPIAKRLLKSWSDHYSDVRVGGPALGDPGGEFVPGRFVKEGVTITSRGCIRNCKWCLVPEREGQIQTYTIQDGWIVQDNNLLACHFHHIVKVFKMLKRINKPVKFSGGLDPRLLRPWHVALLDEIKIDEMWFSCDYPGAEKPLERVAQLVARYPINKRRAFVLIGFNGERLKDAEKRLETVYGLEFLPFAQLYQGKQLKTYSRDWQRLARKWSRPAAYRTSQ